jgi:lipoprotein-releasing system ATP-binding protein
MRFLLNQGSLYLRMIPTEAGQLILSARNIHKYYGALHVLQGVDLDIHAGEIVSMVGPSGSGKSTLLHILGTLDEPEKGEIYLKYKELHTLKGKYLASFRNKHIGFVFQFHHLLPEFTALENVCIPGWIAGKAKTAVEARARELLETLGVGHRMENKPSAMSGGEQQRVAVCRALINSPDIIFADEPTGNLDSANAKDLHQLFFELREKFNQTFLVVTHNEALAGMSDRVLRMKDGKIQD